MRFLRLTGTPRRPHLTVWATVDTRVEGDQWPGGCYLTAAALTKDAPASLVLALPRGIFTVRIEGEPPRPQWLPFCDRTFFDAGPTALRPRRLDFLVDLDGDGTPEIWMPHDRTPPGLLPNRRTDQHGKKFSCRPCLYASGSRSVLHRPDSRRPSLRSMRCGSATGSVFQPSV